MNHQAKNWVPIFKSFSESEVNIVKALLADNDIMAEAISSADHSIDSLNLNEPSTLYVHEQDLEAAQEIIQNHTH